MAYLWNNLTNFNDLRVNFRVLKHAQSIGIGFKSIGHQGHDPKFKMAATTHIIKLKMAYLWNNLTDFDDLRTMFKVLNMPKSSGKCFK